MKFNQDVPYNRDYPIRWSLIDQSTNFTKHVGNSRTVFVMM